jgi:hypothetical protein
MALPGSDEPESISHDEARQELFGRGPSRLGMKLYEVIGIVLRLSSAVSRLTEHARQPA